MPRGERSQTWFPELVAELRQSWRADPTWEAVIDLRDQLQRRVQNRKRRWGEVFRPPSQEAADEEIRAYETRA